MIAFTPQTIAQLYVDIDYLNLGIGTTLLNLAKEQSTDCETLKPILNEIQPKLIMVIIISKLLLMLLKLGVA